MKAEVKAQWVKDLRSGEFEQGRFALDQVDDGKRKQCCLGVLCLQAVKAGVIPAPELHGRIYAYLDDLYDSSGIRSGESFRQKDGLPRKVMEWAGLDSDNPKIHDRHTAAGMNDDGETSFAQIADLIEQNVSAE